MLPTAGAARVPRRPERRRFRARHVGAARHARGPRAARRRRFCRSRAPKGSTRTPRRSRCDSQDQRRPAMSHYQKPPELYDGLRLHQNENTGGCSPRVLEALRALRPDQIGFYPPYAAATDARARGISASTADRIALTNGLDEGIMALAVALPAAGGRRPASRKRSSPSRRSRSSASTPTVAGGAARAGDAAAGLQLSARRGARGDHAATRASSS